MFRSPSFAVQLFHPLAMLLTLAAGAAALAQPNSDRQLTLSVLSADKFASSLSIGDDLAIDLFGASPGERYSVVLEAEDGTEVAALSATANADGEVRRLQLWQRSGVVGCDPGREPDPWRLRFRSFAEAEQHLTGRSFSVAVALTAGEEVLVKLDLPLVDAGTSRFYFSDSEGCYRGEVCAEEDLFLSAHDVVSGSTPLRFFLVPSAPTWAPGDTLDEARPQFALGPQQFNTVPNQSSFIAQVWGGGSMTVGEFDGFVRRAASDQPLLKGSDQFVVQDNLPDAGHRGGIVIRPTCDRPPETF